MRNGSGGDDEWVLVGRNNGKKRRPGAAAGVRTHGPGGHRASTAAPAPVSDSETNARVSSAKEAAIRQRVRDIARALRADGSILHAALAVLDAHYHHHHQSHAQESEAPNEHPQLHVISYGLGSFCTSTNAVHQLAFIVALAAERQLLQCEIYDPVMNASDRAIAEGFGLQVIGENECGRRTIASRTLFFMPHCGQSLYQNVLLANWGPRLEDLIIIGNSFEAYGDRLIDASARRRSLLLQLLPFADETPLPLGLAKSHEDYRLFEAAFNDLSVHVFPSAKIKQALEDTAIAELIAALREDETSGTGSKVTAAADPELITAST